MYLGEIMKRIAPLLSFALFLASTAIADEAIIVAPQGKIDVADLRGTPLANAQSRLSTDSLAVSPAERSLRQHSTFSIGTGDFLLRATVVFDEANGLGAGVVFDGGAVLLDDPQWGAVLTGRLFGGGKFPFETERPASARPGAPMEIEIERADGVMVVRINEFEMGRIGVKDFAIGRVGFDLAAGAMRVLESRIDGDFTRIPRPLAVFTGADGDIDEFRDPSLASDGKRALVGAIAVSTAADGSTKNSLHARFITTADDSGITIGDAFTIETSPTEVDIVTLGYRAGDARPWKLLAQATSAGRLAESLVAFDSADGRGFTRSGEINSNARLQLLPGAMRTLADGRVVAGATRVVDGQPRACAVELDGANSWKFVDLDAAPGCEPMWLSDATVLVRIPREATRQLLVVGAADGARRPMTGFEGASTVAAPITARGELLRVAQADPGFPYPLQELVSSDGGATWTRARSLWGSAAGHACSAELAGQRVIVFEGGDRARREHVLLLRLPEASEPTPKSVGTNSAIGPAIGPAIAPATAPR